AGNIKANQTGRGVGASNIGKNSPPIAIPSFAHHPAVITIRPVPNALRLIGKHTGTTDLTAQQATRRVCNVTNHLSFHAEPRTSRQEMIVWVALYQSWRSC